jgi:hypothetical protein
MYCKRCHNVISDGSSKCPICGKVFNRLFDLKTIIMIIFSFLLICGLSLSSSLTMILSGSGYYDYDDDYTSVNLTGANFDRYFDIYSDLSKESSNTNSTRISYLIIISPSGNHYKGPSVINFEIVIEIKYSNSYSSYTNYETIKVSLYLSNNYTKTIQSSYLIYYSYNNVSSSYVIRVGNLNATISVPR